MSPHKVEMAADLWNAAKAGNVDEVRRLLEAGVNPNTPYMSYATGISAPLYIATEYGRANVVKLLLEYGADPNMQGNLGFTPLFSAVRFGRIEIVKELLAWGASIHWQLGGRSILEDARAKRYSYPTIGNAINVAIVAAELLEKTETGAGGFVVPLGFDRKEITEAAVELMKRRAGLRRGHAAAVYTGPRGGSRQRRRKTQRHRRSRKIIRRK